MSSSLSNPAGGGGGGVVSMDIDDVVPPAATPATTTSSKRNSTNDDIHQLPWVEKYRPQRYVLIAVCVACIVCMYLCVSL